jgi:hypothetical protein
VRLDPSDPQSYLVATEVIAAPLYRKLEKDSPELHTVIITLNRPTAQALVNDMSGWAHVIAEHMVTAQLDAAAIFSYAARDDVQSIWPDFEMRAC